MKPATIPKTIKVWGSGQMTLPMEIRRDLGLGPSDVLTAFRVGEAIVLTPKRLRRAALSKAVQKEMKKKGLRLGDLLKELERQRKRYAVEVYGTRGL